MSLILPKRLYGVTPSAYRLKLPHGMRQLHPVFNVVKLSAAPEDPILGRKLQALPPPIVIDGEKEWEVEEILNSRWHRRRFQFLVKWKGFSREHNSWEVASDVKALDLVAEYYRKHPAALRRICQTDFDAIFNPGVTLYKSLGKLSNILHLNNRNNQLERRARPPRNVPLDA